MSCPCSGYMQLGTDGEVSYIDGPDLDDDNDVDRKGGTRSSRALADLTASLRDQGGSDIADIANDVTTASTGALTIDDEVSGFSYTPAR